MKKSEFKFTDTQRQELLRCWKREGDHSKAGNFLTDVEFRIGMWLPKTVEPRKSEAEKIAIAKRVQRAATQMLGALLDLSPDVAAFLNVMWLHEAYGAEYFQRHSAACEAAEKLSAEKAYRVGFIRGLTDKEPPEVPTEVSQLPPDFLAQIETVKTWLQHLEAASEQMGKILSGAKKWQDKELEKELLFAVALDYQRHFGKPPSSKNGSSFRKFAADLSRISGFEFGACIVKECCEGAARISPERFTGMF